MGWDSGLIVTRITIRYCRGQIRVRLSYHWWVRYGFAEFQNLQSNWLRSVYEFSSFSHLLYHFVFYFFPVFLRHDRVLQSRTRRRISFPSS
ncbi:hypothetical protein BDZ91DRAFT_723051 [Kalaharituber pfeilii]|nr:hypothetical protein BDZ91DRAFT_723051 [Kalaharituber pfeilii]